MNLTAERLRYLLDYNEDTGAFLWRNPTSNRVSIGQCAGVIDRSTGYVRIRLDGTLFHAHRLAWLYVHGEWPEDELDHRNRIKSDNTIRNLRQATHAENMKNMPLMKSNKSGVAGVYWCNTSKRWIASIEVDCVKRCLGYFRDKSAAIEARMSAEPRLFGRFAPIRITDNGSITA